MMRASINVRSPKVPQCLSQQGPTSLSESRPQLMTRALEVKSRQGVAIHRGSALRLKNATKRTEGPIIVVQIMGTAQVQNGA